MLLRLITIHLILTFMPFTVFYFFLYCLVLLYLRWPNKEPLFQVVTSIIIHVTHTILTYAVFIRQDLASTESLPASFTLLRNCKLNFIEIKMER